jgi:outer membrane protein assembly factor BamB
LDANTGEKLWEFDSDSHTESSPCVIGGKVYCGAGDDGIYCLDARKGEKVWQFPSFHIDASPVIVGEHIFVGCGVGDKHRTTAVFCLDRKKGQPRWRCPTDLPVWGRTLVKGDVLYVGTGNGQFNKPADNPAGAVLCVRVRDGGEVWKHKLPDGVFGTIAADESHLYVGCRDGFFYCLRQVDGSQVWRRPLGKGVIAGPALAEHERVYAASSDGYVACMEPATGKLIWALDLPQHTKSKVELFSTPALELVATKDGGKVRRLYVGLTLVSTGRTGELHCYEEMAGTTE